MTAPDYFDGRLFTALRAFVAAERGAVFCGCTFKECNFQGADLASFSFEDCVFADCNLSLI
ncbi:pentapeptide repeat-containing protein [Candidatus Avelusimicrobium alvi]